MQMSISMNIGNGGGDDLRSRVEIRLVRLFYAALASSPPPPDSAAPDADSDDDSSCDGRTAFELGTAVGYLGSELRMGEEYRERGRTENDTDNVSPSSFVDPSFFGIHMFHQIVGRDDYQPVKRF
jgi:hypothetical protein